MHRNWPDLPQELTPPIRDLRVGAPKVLKSFSAMRRAALETRALDTKTKELIELAIAVVIRCDDCIAFHA